MGCETINFSHPNLQEMCTFPANCLRKEQAMVSVPKTGAKKSSCPQTSKVRLADFSLRRYTFEVY